MVHHTPTSLKLLALGSLTLAIKMDDAEMVTKFCLNYVCSPERTIKRNTSNQQLKAKRVLKDVPDFYKVIDKVYYAPPLDGLQCHELYYFEND